MVSWGVLLQSSLLLLAAYLLRQLLAKRGNSVQFHWRYFIFYFLSTCYAIVVIPFFAFRPKDVRNCLWVPPVMKPVSRLMGMSWELRGGHILAEDKGFVIVANHQTSLDALGMFNIWDVVKKCTTTARREVFYLWPFGLATYLAGMIFFDRKNAKDAYRQLEVTTNLMTKEKTKLWMFPEGTRNKRGGLLPFRRGAFKMAVAAQVPIVPVVFSPYYFISKEKLFFGPGRVIITSLDPIDTKGLTDDDITDLAERTRAAMLKVYEEVSREVLSALPADYPLSNRSS